MDRRVKPGNDDCSLIAAFSIQSRSIRVPAVLRPEK
jgi:hypothetical protein